METLDGTAKRNRKTFAPKVNGTQWIHCVMVWAVFVPHEAFNTHLLAHSALCKRVQFRYTDMTKKNQSKSDKKTRKYKQRRAQFLAEAAQLKKETEKLKKECAEQSKKTDKKFEEVGKKIEEVAEQQKKTDEQIGGLGNKFGGYTEAMARPAIRRILEERFHAHYLGPVRFKSTNEVEAVEVDAWGLSRNGTGTAYLVEIKSKFRDEHIAQVWKQVERFRIHYSAIWEQAVYPMLAVVDISEEGREKVWNAGIHLIEIDDGVFQYAKPPKDFEADGYRGMRGVRRDVPHLRAVPG